MLRRRSPKVFITAGITFAFLVLITKILGPREYLTSASKRFVTTETNKTNVNGVDRKWNATVFRRISNLYSVDHTDCRAVLEGDDQVLNASIKMADKSEFQGERKTNDDIIRETQSCEDFIRNNGYITSSLSQVEEHFPLAYSIMVFKDIEPVERLLRAIYRPQNMYCLHVDAKSDEVFYRAVSGIAACFDNVLMAPRRIDVQWMEFTVLEPDLVCMEELYTRSHKWKYFINLTGQEFPLKNNRELVEILTVYRGANDVEGVRANANVDRWQDAGPVPGNLVPTKGAVHVVLNRDFCKFTLRDPRAAALLEWVKPQKAADETFFSTINHNPRLGVPGECPPPSTISLAWK